MKEEDIFMKQQKTQKIIMGALAIVMVLSLLLPIVATIVVR